MESASTCLQFGVVNVLELPGKTRDVCAGAALETVISKTKEVRYNTGR